MTRQRLRIVGAVEPVVLCPCRTTKRDGNGNRPVAGTGVRIVERGGGRIVGTRGERFVVLPSAKGDVCYRAARRAVVCLGVDRGGECQRGFGDGLICQRDLIIVSGCKLVVVRRWRILQRNGNDRAVGCAGVCIVEHSGGRVVGAKGERFAALQSDESDGRYRAGRRGGVGLGGKRGGVNGDAFLRDAGRYRRRLCQQRIIAGFPAGQREAGGATQRTAAHVGAKRARCAAFVEANRTLIAGNDVVKRVLVGYGYMRVAEVCVAVIYFGGAYAAGKGDGSRVHGDVHGACLRSRDIVHLPCGIACRVGHLVAAVRNGRDGSVVCPCKRAVGGAACQRRGGQCVAVGNATGCRPGEVWRVGFGDRQRVGGRGHVVQAVLGAGGRYYKRTGFGNIGYLAGRRV